MIPGRRIVTNAHVVSDHTFVLVRKHGSPTKYKAEVQAVGHECDLALLTVDSKEFWDGMNFLELGDIPYLQEAVAVVGYPQGMNTDFRRMTWSWILIFLFTNMLCIFILFTWRVIQTDLHSSSF